MLYVVEAVLAAEAQLLRDARDAEWLAGEAAAQDVVRGDVGYGDSVNVAVRALAEIGLVGLLTEFVVIGGEDALRAHFLKRDAEAADAAEQVNEAWRRSAILRRVLADDGGFVSALALALGDAFRLCGFSVLGR